MHIASSWKFPGIALAVQLRFRISLSWPKTSRISFTSFSIIRAAIWLVDALALAPIDLYTSTLWSLRVGPLFLVASPLSFKASKQARGALINSKAGITTASLGAMKSCACKNCEEKQAQCINVVLYLNACR